MVDANKYRSSDSEQFAIFLIKQVIDSNRLGVMLSSKLFFVKIMMYTEIFIFSIFGVNH